MSDTEASDVNVSVTLPPPSQAEATENQVERSQVNASSDLESVKDIMKATRDGDPLEDKDSFYPLQQKTTYMSPGTTLSSESKRIVRQAQVPILQASPRVVHFLYEVRSKKRNHGLPGKDVNAMQYSANTLRANFTD